MEKHTQITDLVDTNPHADAIVSRLAPVTLYLSDKDKAFKEINDKKRAD